MASLTKAERWVCARYAAAWAKPCACTPHVRLDASSARLVWGRDGSVRLSRATQWWNSDRARSRSWLMYPSGAVRRARWPVATRADNPATHHRAAQPRRQPIPKQRTALPTTISVDTLLDAPRPRIADHCLEAPSCPALPLRRDAGAPFEFARDPRRKTRAVSRCGARKSPC
jgi:hypothetical protein